MICLISISGVYILKLMKGGGGYGNSSFAAIFLRLQEKETSRRAADVLHVTQPTLSRQLKRP